MIPRGIEQAFKPYTPLGYYMRKASPFAHEPDTAGEKAVKGSVSANGTAPSHLKENAQSGGVWCPLCKKHHRQSSSCWEARR